MRSLIRRKEDLWLQSIFCGLGLLQCMLAAGKWRSQECQCLIEGNACKRLNMFWLCCLKAYESQKSSECSKGREQSQFLTFSTQIKLLFLGRLCKTILYHTNGQKWKQAQMLTALKSRDEVDSMGEVQKGALLTIMINACGFSFTLVSVTNTRLSIHR